MDKCVAFCQTLVMSDQKFTFSLSLGKDNFNFSNKELVESSWKMNKKSPSQKRSGGKRKLERSKMKVAERVTESNIEVNEKVCKEVSGKETETSLYAEKASDVKAAEEVDLSIESHTEEVRTESTVLVKNSIAFEC